MLRTSVISKSAMVATVLALALATFSATSVFAAGTQTANAQAVSQNLTSQWKAELVDLRNAQLMSADISKWHNNWLTTNTKLEKSDMASADQFISRFNSYLSQAEAVAGTHTGLNNSGVATDNIQATKSLNSLSWYLHEAHMVYADQITRLIR